MTVSILGKWLWQCRIAPFYIKHLPSVFILLFFVVRDSGKMFLRVECSLPISWLEERLWGGFVDCEMGLDTMKLKWMSVILDYLHFLNFLIQSQSLLICFQVAFSSSLNFKFEINVLWFLSLYQNYHLCKLFGFVSPSPHLF